MALLKLRPLSCLALLLAVGGLLLPAGCGRTEGRAGAEVRGVWLHPTWGTEPTTALPAVRRQVRDLASLGFNMIFPLVENHLAYYPSSAAAPYKGWDGLDYPAALVDESRRQGMEAHLWTCVYHMSDLLQQRPEYASVDRAGKASRWMACPARPQVRARALAAAVEIMDRYPDAGVHLDYVRFESGQHCYCDHCRQTFRGVHGVDPLNLAPLDPRWVTWRAEQVTDLVRRVRQAADARSPRRVVSAAVFSIPDPNQAFVEQGQKWVRWLEDGLLDFAVPMNYVTSHGEFSRWTRNALAAAAGLKIHIGVGLFEFEKDTREAAVQVRLARQLGAGGVVLFRAKYLDAPFRRQLEGLFGSPSAR